MSTTSLPTLRGINISGLMAQLLNFIPMPKAIQSIMGFWKKIQPIWNICKRFLSFFKWS